jgi:rare lipoprotein A (peptidoglycan hydrolase)
MKVKLLTLMLVLTACAVPTKKTNPNISQRPSKTSKFLTSKDYYLEDDVKPKTKEVAKVKEKTEDEIEEYARLDFPVNKHQKRGHRGFTLSDNIDEEYKEFSDDSKDALKEAEKVVSVKDADETPLYDEQGLASWYGPGFHGRQTANGEKFNQNAMTAAHRKLPLGTMVEVTNLETGKTITVRINDRGPYSGKRIIDLSKAAAQELGIIHNGTGMVGVKVAR